MEEDNVSAKSIFTSRTFWVNLLTVIFMLVNRKEQIIDPDIIDPLVVVILPLLNIGLRAITKEPVRLGME